MSERTIIFNMAKSLLRGETTANLTDTEQIARAYWLLKEFLNLTYDNDARECLICGRKRGKHAKGCVVSMAVKFCADNDRVAELASIYPLNIGTDEPTE